MPLPAEPPHARKLGLLSVDLVKVRVRDLIPTLARVRDELEPALLQWFPNGSFSWVTLCIRLGLKNDDAPVYGRVSKKYGDLPLSIEIDAHEVLAVHHDAELLHRLLYGHTLRSLRSVADRYGLTLQDPREISKA